MLGSNQRECMMVRLLVGVVLFAALVFVSSGQEVKLTNAEVPPSISSVAMKKFPQANFSNWSKEAEDGKTTFQVSVADGVGKRDAVFSPDGALISTETSMQASALPAVVKTAVQAKCPR